MKDGIFETLFKIRSEQKQIPLFSREVCGFFKHRKSRICDFLKKFGVFLLI